MAHPGGEPGGPGGLRRGTDRGGEVGRIEYRRQVDDHDIVAGPVAPVVGHTQRQPGFAHSTGTGKGHEAGLVTTEEFEEVGNLLLATDKRGQRDKRKPQRSLTAHVFRNRRQIAH